MAQTYGVVNLISSLGFCRLWRKQCVQAISIQSNSHVLDLMSGMGELCPNIARKTGIAGSITTIDISPVMCSMARKQGAALARCDTIHVLEADALNCPLEDASVDHVVSSFGLKTFSPEQIEILASEVARVLRPGGTYSFLEISVPASTLLRWPYLFYICYIIPWIGRLMMGNPDNYRLLGVYTTAFGNCNQAADAFLSAGLEVETRGYFFGCATGIVGKCP